MPMELTVRGFVPSMNRILPCAGHPSKSIVAQCVKIYKKDTGFSISIMLFVQAVNFELLNPGG